MIYIIPTKRGLGVEIWGAYEDLDNFHQVIAKFWNNKQYLHNKGFENRDELISGFSYEIRKAKEGNRQKRKSNHNTLEEADYLGTKISWVHFLFSMAAIKYNMGFHETNKFDVSMILQIEFWLEKVMNQYDTIGAKNLIGFIEGGIYAANEHIYQFMRSINYDYFQLNGGKRAFRKLPDLLQRGVLNTDEYKEFQAFLEKESKRLNCKISDIEIDDDHFDYDSLVW
jgi:hypothetical protein